MEAARSADPKLGIIKKAQARGVSAEELGETARKYEIVPSSPIEAAKMNVEDFVERTKAAQDKVGGSIDAIYSGSSATMKKSEVLGFLDKRIADLEKTAAGRTVAR
jgi:hypothetical protein